MNRLAAAWSTLVVEVEHCFSQPHVSCRESLRTRLEEGCDGLSKERFQCIRFHDLMVPIHVLVEYLLEGYLESGLGRRVVLLDCESL